MNKKLTRINKENHVETADEKVVPLPKRPARNLVSKKPKKKVQSGKKTKRVSQPKLNQETPMEVTMTQGKQQFDIFVKQANDLNRDGFDAFVKSATIFGKGYEELVRATISMAQSTAEKQATLAKEAMGTKTLNEWADIQNKIAQTQFDDFMAGATKISELSVKVLTESAQPMNDQLAEGVKKATASVAA